MVLKSTCILATNQNYREAVPGWRAFNTRKQKVLQSAECTLQKILLVSHPGLPFRLVPFPPLWLCMLVFPGTAAPFSREVSSAQGRPLAQEVIYIHSWEWLTPKDWLCWSTKGWLPDAEIGLKLCCSRSPHGMRSKLDILAWFLPLGCYASFFFPSSF